ncbi:hypothetical protein HOG48_01015 [Candidatus Peregrinibacteria bacterium]|jgi:hypothetical protein|nr:hypothetical protein [Candidatus Peregrinibacteria bacterium]
MTRLPDEDILPGRLEDDGEEGVALPTVTGTSSPILEYMAEAAGRAEATDGDDVDEERQLSSREIVDGTIRAIREGALDPLTEEQVGDLEGRIDPRDMRRLQEFLRGLDTELATDEDKRLAGLSIGDAAQNFAEFITGDDDLDWSVFSSEKVPLERPVPLGEIKDQFPELHLALTTPIIQNSSRESWDPPREPLNMPTADDCVVTKIEYWRSPDSNHSSIAFVVEGGPDKIRRFEVQFSNSTFLREFPKVGDFGTNVDFARPSKKHLNAFISAAHTAIDLVKRDRESSEG